MNVIEVLEAEIATRQAQIDTLRECLAFLNSPPTGSAARPRAAALPAAELSTAEAKKRRPYKKRVAAPEALAPEIRPSARKPNLLDKVRAMIATWTEERWTRDELVEAMQEQYGADLPRGWLASIATGLLDMSERGELERNGAGRLATYRTIKVKVDGGFNYGRIGRPNGRSGKPNRVEAEYQKLRGEIHAPVDTDEPGPPAAAL